MPRIRTLKPEFWPDEKLAPLDPTTRLVFLGLISMADDAGRLLDNLKQIDAFIFPETDDSAREALAKLSRIGRIERGVTAQGQKVIQIVNWSRHQKVDHPNLKACLPEVVKDATAYESRESVENDSREVRELLAPRPTTSTSTYDHIPPTRETLFGTPTTLTKHQLAESILIKCHLPHGKSEIEIVASSIASFAAEQQIKLAEAHDFILAAAKAAVDEGITLNRFWFTDQRYKPQPPVESDYGIPHRATPGRATGSAADRRKAANLSATERALRRERERAARAVEA